MSIGQPGYVVGPEIHIRPLREEDKPEVYDVVRRAFPLVARVFFAWTPDVLVAERNGEVLGGVTLKLFPLAGGGKGGLIYWIFTDPDVQGFGIGQKLTEAALEFFNKQGCDEVIAAVEGHNTSSNKLFATRGFSVLSPGQQFKRYGIGVFPLWIRVFHYIDIGHFLWVRPAAKSPDKPAYQWWATVIANALIILLFLWRTQGTAFFAQQPFAFIAVPLIAAFFIGVRTLAMWFAATVQGLSMRFRIWESGITLSTALALIGSYLPIPGSLYPVSGNWKYKVLLPKLAVMALAGVLSVLTFTWVAWMLDRLNTFTGPLSVWVGLTATIGTIFAFFDVLLPFFPFTSFNGRRIWDWNKLIWMILVVIVVILIVL